jgi:predicted CoA-binding protein
VLSLDVSSATTSRAPGTDRRRERRTAEIAEAIMLPGDGDTRVTQEHAGSTSDMRAAGRAPLRRERTMASRNPDDAVIRSLLEGVRRIAVVGLSPKPARDSHRVARYLQSHGYEIVPVYPRQDEILGQKVYRRVQDIPGEIELVDVFRRGEDLPEVTDDVLAGHARALWFQLGCVNEDAAERARAAGLTVVMDRCTQVEHARLLGLGWKRA